MSWNPGLRYTLEYWKLRKPPTTPLSPFGGTSRRNGGIDENLRRMRKLVRKR